MFKACDSEVNNLDLIIVIAVFVIVYFLNLGHDSGMVVFKLERERPAYTVYQNTLYYVKVTKNSIYYNSFTF